MLTQVFDKLGGTLRSFDSTNVALNASGSAKLALSQNDIVSFTRSGADLIIQLASAEVITIVNFFDPGVTETPSELFLESPDAHGVQVAQYTENGTAFSFAPEEGSAALSGNSAGSFLNASPGVWAGLSALGIAGIAGSVDGSSSGPGFASSIPPVPPPPPSAPPPTRDPTPPPVSEDDTDAGSDSDTEPDPDVDTGTDDDGDTDPDVDNGEDGNTDTDCDNPCHDLCDFNVNVDVDIGFACDVDTDSVAPSGSDWVYSHLVNLHGTDVYVEIVADIDKNFDPTAEDGDNGCYIDINFDVDISIDCDLSQYSPAVGSATSSGSEEFNNGYLMTLAESPQPMSEHEASDAFKHALEAKLENALEDAITLAALSIGGDECGCPGYIHQDDGGLAVTLEDLLDNFFHSDFLPATELGQLFGGANGAQSDAGSVPEIVASDMNDPMAGLWSQNGSYEL